MHCAEEAGDWSLRSDVLGDMAMQALFRDQVDDALSLIELATSHLRAALDHSGTISRRRALGTAKLSTLELLNGDRDEGITLAHRALDLGDGMHSARLVDDLRRLRTATARHTGAPVNALRQQLDLVLTSA